MTVIPLLLYIPLLFQDGSVGSKKEEQKKVRPEYDEFDIIRDVSCSKILESVLSAEVDSDIVNVVTNLTNELKTRNISIKLRKIDGNQKLTLKYLVFLLVCKCVLNKDENLPKILHLAPLYYKKSQNWSKTLKYGELEKILGPIRLKKEKNSNNLYVLDPDFTLELSDNWPNWQAFLSDPDIMKYATEQCCPNEPDVKLYIINKINTLHVNSNQRINSLNKIVNNVAKTNKSIEKVNQNLTILYGFDTHGFRQLETGNSNVNIIKMRNLHIIRELKIEKLLYANQLFKLLGNDNEILKIPTILTKNNSDVCKAQFILQCQDNEVSEYLEKKRQDSSDTISKFQNIINDALSKMSEYERENLIADLKFAVTPMLIKKLKDEGAIANFFMSSKAKNTVMNFDVLALLLNANIDVKKTFDEYKTAATIIMKTKDQNNLDYLMALRILDEAFDIILHCPKTLNEYMEFLIELDKVEWNPDKYIKQLSKKNKENTEKSSINPPKKKEVEMPKKEENSSSNNKSSDGFWSGAINGVNRVFGSLLGKHPENQEKDSKNVSPSRPNLEQIEQEEDEFYEIEEEEEDEFKKKKRGSMMYKALNLGNRNFNEAD